MSKKKHNAEPPVTPYQGRYICRVVEYYRVKLNPSDSYAIHYGSFDSVVEAKEYIDYLEEKD